MKRGGGGGGGEGSGPPPRGGGPERGKRARPPRTGRGSRRRGGGTGAAEKGGGGGRRGGGGGNTGGAAPGTPASGPGPGNRCVKKGGRERGEEGEWGQKGVVVTFAASLTPAGARYSVPTTNLAVLVVTQPYHPYRTISTPLPKKGTPYPNMGRALFNGDLKIIGHAHREGGKV